MCNTFFKYQLLIISSSFKLLDGIPTRVAETRVSCLDHFLVKEHYKTISIKTSLSDHFPVLLLLNDEMETNINFVIFKN